MASGKRLQYDDESTSADSSEMESEEDYQQIYNQDNIGRNPTRKPKSFSRNALLARENRLKKKLYMENMEKELTKERQKNKKVTNIIKNQNKLIEKQEKELKYIKSVLANSTEICMLLKNIHSNTGMSVATSLNKDLIFKSNSTSKNSTNTIQEQHPWDLPSPLYSEGLSPPFLMSDDYDIASNFDFEISSNIDMRLPDNRIMDNTSDVSLCDTNIISNLEEHNYTINNSNDVGVCLHISKHKVALEFCSTCSENANQTWEQSH